MAWIAEKEEEKDIYIYMRLCGLKVVCVLPQPVSSVKFIIAATELSHVVEDLLLKRRWRTRGLSTARINENPWTS